MDLSTTLAVVQTIFAAIQTLGKLPSMFSISSFRAELDDLQNTVEKVKAVLEDADAKQELSSQEKNYVQELKDAVYDADDVLDEFLTLAKQQQLRADRDKISNKVKSFFFRFKRLTNNLSSKVKTVNQKFDSIATKNNKFRINVDYTPVKFPKNETSSFLPDHDIIGREDDVKKIVDVLLGSNNVDHPNVSLLAIMGMGGLGKTALAQLVFNDPRISEAFQLKRWTCVADQDQKQLDLKEHLGKVVKGFSVSDKMSLEDIHHVVKKQLGGKRYLLVLDDVWTESYDEWQKFEGYLKIGGSGSWIIVTTRSNITAQMIGDDRVHVLQGLSKSKSWDLFERMAFQGEERDDELVKLGEEIVNKCTNVPLAIRVVGSLLRGQSKSKWQSFHDKGLDFLSGGDDTMTHILKLSYDHLNPSLKSCFAYCAIFPKDLEISKQLLIQLWRAQGYVNSENLGEDYFLILLQRCFFQDVHKDEFGGIKSFKIHDLLHDIAEKVAGEEICRFNYDTSNVGNKARHLCFVDDPPAYHIFNSGKKVRTCLQIRPYQGFGRVDQLLENKCIPKWTCLRSLDLSSSNAKRLPKSIGQLLHLRNLDLSFSRHLEVLPKSITKLVNLQTFDLRYCFNLKQLPDDLSKLVDLSTLNLYGCDALRCMPAGIGMLTCLHTLGQFVMGMRATSTTEQCFNGLKDLKHLNKLKGSLKIDIGVLNAKYVKEEHGGGGYLRSKEHLEKIVFNFRDGKEYGSKESEQALLEEMEPHHDVKTLELNGYHGETLPRWPGRGDSSTVFDFPNLVTLHISSCSELLYLPWQVAKLPRLKTLDISFSSNLEYIVGVDSKTFISAEESSFFASLETLYIFNSPKLKGWWRKSKSGSQVINPSDYGSSREADIEWVSSPCFPLLKTLSLRSCGKRIFVPSCPRLERLDISCSKGELVWKDTRSTARHQLSSPLSYPNLKTLRINNVEWLESMPVKYTQFLEEIHIANDERVESLGEIKELLPPCLLSSLRTLRITDCPKLKSVGGWLEHLSALEKLRIEFCPKVELGGMSWHNLAPTLLSLELNRIKEMEELPEGMQYCTSLRSLSFGDCSKLKSMPKWMPKLTSLQSLNLGRCSESLKERCQKPNGEDWPLIQHISELSVW